MHSRMEGLQILNFFLTVINHLVLKVKSAFATMRYLSNTLREHILKHQPCKHLPDV